jgi:hypothetical protein
VRDLVIGKIAQLCGGLLVQVFALADHHRRVVGQVHGRTHVLPDGFAGHRSGRA